jgi:uncharacterized RDD family membrane protein YckC
VKAVPARLALGSPARLEGHYAGMVTRFAAFVVDIALISVLFSIGGSVAEYILSLLLGDRVQLADSVLSSRLALAVWAFVYFAVPMSASGRTCGMGLVGLRVVRADGGDLGPGHVVIRVLALPLSFLLLGLGFALIVLRRDRRALHDLIAGSAVVYAWDARAARLRFLARQ